MVQINKPSDYFSTTIYTGTTAQQSVNTGIDMANNGSMLWVKDRDTTNNQNLFDTYMGINHLIFPSATDAKYAETRLVSFDSTGYTAVGGSGGVNQNGNRHVAWNWLAGSSQAGSSNTDGSITSTVSANTTSGFSMVTYTGTGIVDSTVGHGLGAKVDFLMIKDLGNVSNWIVGHKDTFTTGEIYLNSTAALSAAFGPFNKTAPTTSVFNLGTDVICNGSGRNYVAYCFAEKKGYSKFGSYTGNGNADGPFIYTGFKPGLLIRKRTDASNDWYINDNKRAGYNPQNDYLFPNSVQIESALQRFDFLSNGFKIRTTDTGDNASGGTYIYMAFAENPLVGTNNIPTTAR